MQSTEFTNRRKQDRVGELFDKKLPSVPHQVPFFTHVPPPPPPPLSLSTGDVHQAVRVYKEHCFTDTNFVSVLLNFYSSSVVNQSGSD